ncbi:hypothetical protein CLOP_g15744 [Closterium sp. NIES-67]|nr:hypothetical protein CLOP_g15744 [Closterium sp. NIES-67]
MASVGGVLENVAQLGRACSAAGCLSRRALSVSRSGFLVDVVASVRRGRRSNRRQPPLLSLLRARCSSGVSRQDANSARISRVYPDWRGISGVVCVLNFIVLIISPLRVPFRCSPRSSSSCPPGPSGSPSVEGVRRWSRLLSPRGPPTASSASSKVASGTTSRCRTRRRIGLGRVRGVSATAVSSDEASPRGRRGGLSGRVTSDRSARKTKGPLSASLRSSSGVGFAAPGDLGRLRGGASGFGESGRGPCPAVGFGGVVGGRLSGV